MKKTLKTTGIILMISTLVCCENKPELPLVLTSNPSEISAMSAVGGGIISDDGGATVIEKGICWDTTPEPTTDKNKKIGSGESLSFSVDMTGLLPNTGYYVRAYAVNSAGTGYGESKQFKTLGDKPASYSQNPSNIQTTAATLNGTVNPNSLETVIIFEYGLTTSYGKSAAASQSPVSGSVNKTVSAELTQLDPGTTYHFRIKAENTLGITYSDDLFFRTLGQVPSVVTPEARNIEVTSALLSGSVNPNSLNTTITFEYGTTSNYGSSIPAQQSPLSGDTNGNVTAQLTGLAAGTIYHYRIKAENSLGITYSGDLTFTTIGQIPSILAVSATGIGLNSATLSGSVNQNHLSTSVIFEWGLTTSYGTTVSPERGTIIGSESATFEVSLSGLTPGTSYHYRVTATNLLGTKSSSDMIFSTNINDNESNIYKTITIGNQLWLSENLRSTRYNDGTPVQIIEANDQWSAAGNAAYSWYNNDFANKNVNGAIYNYYVVDQSQNGNKNICPSGWHIPKKLEWTILFNYLSQNGYGSGGVSSDISKSIASTSGWEPAPSAGLVGNDQPSNNSSGFNGYPTGMRSYNGAFTVFGRWAGWWNQPDDYMLGYSPWYSVITNDTKTVNTIGLGMNYGASVRCIKD